VAEGPLSDRELRSIIIIRRGAHLDTELSLERFRGIVDAPVDDLAIVSANFGAEARMPLNKYCWSLDK